MEQKRREEMEKRDREEGACREMQTKREEGDRRFCGAEEDEKRQTPEIGTEEEEVRD